MRILYWYTRFLTDKKEQGNYRGLNSFELNLSTKERFRFDGETRVFTCNALEPPLPDKFWGASPLYNFNALIGENGSGKTAIMHYMIKVLHNLHDRKNEGWDETLILLENGSEKHLLHLCPFVEECALSPSSCDRVTYHLLKPGGLYDDVLGLLDSFKLIYHTNTLTLSDSERAKGLQSAAHRRHHYVFDCSTSALMHASPYDTVRGSTDLDSVRNNADQTQLHRFFQNEFLHQIVFFTNKKLYKAIKGLKNGCEFHLPSALTIRILGLEEAFDSHFFCFPDKSLFDPHTKLTLTLCCACARAFEYNLRNHALPHLRLQQSYNIASVELQSFQRLFRRILREALYDPAINQEPDFMEIENLYKSSLELIAFLFQGLDEFKDIAVSTEERSFIIPLTDKGKPIQNNIEWLKDFFSRYHVTCDPFVYLDFSWGLSSGESNLLRLFSSLYHVLDESDSKIINKRVDSHGIIEVKTSCNSVLLLLDEADLTYHPEWQRRYVSTLVALLPVVFADAGLEDIQVLLSTHSPLMLGDMPSSNVTYLPAVRESIESFGQNIHLILKNSFFLKNTLGSFASQKIQETLLSFQKPAPISADEMERCNSIIKLLAPGPVKYKLKEFYQKAGAKQKSEQKLIDQVNNAELSREKLEQLIGQLQIKLDKLDANVKAFDKPEGGQD